MAKHDIVVVPSRHEYPEGLPNTIYEGLASRSPLIISDHPAYVNRFTDREDCLIFSAADSSDLAEKIESLMCDVALYNKLSKNSLNSLDSLYIGIEWTVLIGFFLGDPRNQTGWVQGNSLGKLGL